MNKIKKIYRILSQKFGNQGWWPLTLEGFEPKHHVGRPKTAKHKFEIIIGAILTQNTNWKNVEKALYNLSKNNLIDIKKINKIKKEKLAKLIKPSGYYNQKAERLKIISNYILKNYKGNIDYFFNHKKNKSKKSINELRKELLKLKGVGPETADSIILYAAEKPIFVIDAYTKRIYSRIFNIKKGLKYEELQKIFENNLKKDTQLFNEYHALLVELGKNYCKGKNPLCEECSINIICDFNKNKNI
jgi:endonuclease-3 related protein